MRETADRHGKNHSADSFTIRNTATGAVLATCARIAGTSAERRQGLLRSDTLRNGEGLWIIPCEAIHTFQMKFSIDAVFVDRARQVRKVCANLTPWRVAGCLRADSVLELPAGVVADSGTSVGDRLEFLANGSLQG